jgi:hypothetical protein
MPNGTVTDTLCISCDHTTVPHSRVLDGQQVGRTAGSMHGCLITGAFRAFTGVLPCNEQHNEEMLLHPAWCLGPATQRRWDRGSLTLLWLAGQVFVCTAKARHNMVCKLAPHP